MILYCLFLDFVVKHIDILIYPIVFQVGFLLFIYYLYSTHMYTPFSSSSSSSGEEADTTESSADEDFDMDTRSRMIASVVGSSSSGNSGEDTQKRMFQFHII